MHLQSNQETDNFGYSNNQTRNSIKNQTASATIKCLDVVIVKIMKVRPQDPSRVT
jgi:hypothetical protein